ncbi:MAG: TetR/AcrR family transcriptional regulator [Aquihabitans sp.]
MPRITADTVAEHVAHQQAAVLDAAVRLFVERGYAEVTLADVAAEVGLARSSLYRYVPDKLHLLVEWYRRTVPETIEAWEDAVSGDDPPTDRLIRWAHTYLTWAASPEHEFVAPLTQGLSQLDEETRLEVATLHRSMMGVVAGVVADAGIPEAQVPGTVDVLAGLVTGAARAEAGRSEADADVRRRLDAAVAALLEA